MPYTRRLLFVLALALLTGASAAQLRQVAVIDIPGRPGFDRLAWAAGHLVIAHPANNSVDIFDPARRRVVAQVKEMSDPRGIAVDEQAGRVYVANAGSSSLAVISTGDWKLMETIALPASPSDLLLVPALGKLFISNWRQGSISVVSLADRKVTTVEVGGRPEHMVFDPATKLVFANVQDSAETIALDDSLRVVRRYKLAASQPTGIALDDRQRRLFVAVRYAVVILHPDDGKEIGRVPSGAGVNDLWFDQEKGTLYAATNGGTVTMISLGGDRYQTEHELQTTIRGHSLAVDPAKKMVYMPGGFEGRSKLVILKRIETPGTADADQPSVARKPLPRALPHSFPPLPKAEKTATTPETAQIERD